VCVDSWWYSQEPASAARIPAHSKVNGSLDSHCHGLALVARLAHISSISHYPLNHLVVAPAKHLPGFIACYCKQQVCTRYHASTCCSIGGTPTCLPTRLAGIALLTDEHRTWSPADSMLLASWRTSGIICSQSVTQSDSASPSHLICQPVLGIMRHSTGTSDVVFRLQMS
jgi:hypothetical protein